MKNLLIFFSGIVAAFGVFGLYQKIFPSEPIIEQVEIIRSDTLVVTKVDTLRITNTVYQCETIVDTVTILVPVPGEKEPITLDLVKVQREFAGDKYKAWVSGIDPYLDSIEVYNNIIEKTVTIREIEREKAKRWGLGVQAGMTYDLIHSNPYPYIGIGVSYNIIRW